MSKQEGAPSPCVAGPGSLLDWSTPPPPYIHTHTAKWLAVVESSMHCHLILAQSAKTSNLNTGVKILPVTPVHTELGIPVKNGLKKQITSTKLPRNSTDAKHVQL